MTPGALVSSGNGARPSPENTPAPSSATEGPVHTYPPESRATAPASHPVHGSAPMNTMSSRAGTLSRAPERVSSTTTASSTPSSPRSSRTSVCTITSIRPSTRMRSAR